MTMIDPTSLALLDSNILVYADQKEQPQYKAAKSLRDHALTGKITACISPQVINEFYAVSTNPRRVSAPLTVQEATDQIRRYAESEDLALIHPGPGIVGRALSLMENHPVSGSDIYDLYMVATMLENGITRICTFNTRDFAPFSEIEVLTPPEPESESEPSPEPDDHPTEEPTA